MTRDNDGFGYRRFDARAHEVSHEQWARELHLWAGELDGRREWVEGGATPELARSGLLALTLIKGETLAAQFVLDQLVQEYGHARLLTFIDIWCDLAYGPPGLGVFRTPRGNLQSAAIARNVKIVKENRWACDNIEAWVTGRKERRQALRVAGLNIKPATLYLRAAWTITMICCDQQSTYDFTQLDGASPEQLRLWLKRGYGIGED